MNIAEIAFGIQTLGPGSRVVIWTQGCVRCCPGCISPEFQPVIPAQIFRVDDLASLLVRNKQTCCGLTISGGEPMLQASGVVQLWNQIKQVLPAWDLIVFSGYLRDELLKKHTSGQVDLLEQCDAFIGGPFVQSRKCEIGLRGSSNQEIYFPKQSSFPLAERKVFFNCPQQQQLFFSGSTFFLAGIPSDTGRVTGVIRPSSHDPVRPGRKKML